MSLHRRPLRALLPASDGATLVEFGLVVLPFLTLLMGALDLGYQVYLSALTNGAMERAARKATVASTTKAQVAAAIRAEVRTILPAGSRDDPAAVTVTPLSYTNFASIGKGERIVADTAPVGQYNSTDCYEDRNNNGRYDATFGGGDDMGTADDVIYYDVIVKVPRLFPLARAIGLGPDTIVDARTLIRNQPYGDQQIRVRCS
ncbi:TadE/TadG family type IV pilus assembly protein [Sphingomonas phyllosphaerae]|uniref:TadE/TadG family type IV pilus assembly protein n=1 Tax=Sphingomonas phyllosphaerae TaxID=257003 RepID=UPI00040D95C1|nr:TadE/TadG family type IV pilus assembly protein [Sphingomonas phyllosphaerae]